ncbi:hypothetical protein Pla8534_29900 [Lignipirellula cremea]|uniref:Uncharacterized protein n=1 Tax=Lignipirellula cremea TaxID=2528010 RepID=A0A518DTP3_9BACT|nr:hypothetical protein Pla8534_29900 [Lignipirellula cremea]
MESSRLFTGRAPCFFELDLEKEPEQSWTGAIHYMELVDCTEGAHTKLHSVLAPVVPRIGEMVTPQKGSRMRVVDVEHVVVSQGGNYQMIPYVYLETEEADEDG